MNVASLDKDYFPEPPTPTSKACPWELAIILEILHVCFIASSKRTRSMTALVSLYSLKPS
jgi:hypothetical protein